MATDLVVSAAAAGALTVNAVGSLDILGSCFPNQVPFLDSLF